MTETIPIKKQIGLPPWLGAFTPNRETIYMAKLSNTPTKLVEFGSITEVYVDGIGRIDSGGAISHLIWYVRHNDAELLGTSRVATLRMIIPTEALATLARQLANPSMFEDRDPERLTAECDGSPHYVVTVQ
jgi:hypothetical protein